jgi:hypothetical protein
VNGVATVLFESPNGQQTSALWKPVMGFNSTTFASFSAPVKRDVHLEAGILSEQRRGIGTATS